MSDASDISRDRRQQSKYCIARTPRGGSTLLSRMLERAALAGSPEEYLNPLLISAWMCLHKATAVSLPEYMADIESRKTSENGMFGSKVHWRHLEQLCEMKISEKWLNDFLLGFDRFIFIRRADKVA